MAEAAAYSGLSASQLRLLARNGEIEAWKLGHAWYTTRKAVAAYLRDEARRRPGRRSKPNK